MASIFSQMLPASSFLNAIKRLVRIPKHIFTGFRNFDLPACELFNHAVNVGVVGIAADRVLDNEMARLLV